jgi:hypothetical protein
MVMTHRHLTSVLSVDNQVELYSPSQQELIANGNGANAGMDRKGIVRIP